MKGKEWAAILILYIFTALHADGSCPRDWLSFSTQCIKIFNGTNSFPFSQLLCELNAGKLASVSSEEMLEFLSVHTYSYRDSNFWVGVRQNGDGVYFWYDGVVIENDLPWVQQNYSMGGVCFVYTGAKVERVECRERHGFICSRNKTLYNPTEKCLEGKTEHSFIGEVTGHCVYRTPGAASKENVDAECSKEGGTFLDLDDIISDGVTAFVQHQVMVNDSFKYWTGLTLNGTTLTRPSGEPYSSIIPFHRGRGECVTVSFSVVDVLKTELFQTECRDHAYAICSMLIPSFQFRTIEPRLPPLEQQLLSCPPGQNWKVYPVTDSCFWETSFETRRLSWGDARKYCQAYGGDLASFHNQDEEKIGLSFQYGSHAHPYWIGLYLDPHTETYKWSDGSPLDYENWAPGHPNHKDKRLRCVAMDADETHWISSLCGIVSWFVCRAPKTVNPPVPVVPTREPLIPCDRTAMVPEWFYFQGYCYKVSSSRYSWHRAKEYCENRDSYLVSIHSDEEIGYILRILYDNRQMIGNRVWIGLSALSSGVLKWTDWTPLDYTYWNDGEPNNHDNQEKCVNMYIGNGLWNDENCNSAMGFICKQNKDANVTVQIPTTRDPTVGNCRKGWYAHHDRCYLPVGLTDKEKVNWTQASENCISLGGYLVSVRNAGEQAYLSYLLQILKDDAWIGLHDTFQSGKYYWMDNSDIQYTNWAPGEPSFFGIQEDCVKMAYDELNSGVWRDDECSKRLPYICQSEKDPDLVKPYYNRGLSCIYPEGWLKLDDMCFKMFTGNPLSWQEAESACEREGAHLVSLSGSSVQAISTYLGMEVNQTYWIGLKYEESTRKFKWLNGWPMGISKWGKNEPVQPTEEACYTSTSDGFWKNVPCNEEMPFICQITTGKPPVPKSYTGECPKTSELWIPTDGSQCHMYDKSRFDWFSANLRCFRHGSYLISIHSLEEVEQIRKTLKPGLQSIFIGLMRNNHEGFSWTDQSSVDFVNWEEDQPDDSDDNCVAMMADTLKWRVVNCLSRMYFLCTNKKDTEIEGIPESAKYSADSSIGVSVGALAGILVVSILILIVIILGALFFRPGSLGRSRFRNPFRQHSVSYENALYNAHSASMEFQEEDTNDGR